MKTLCPLAVCLLLAASGAPLLAQHDSSSDEQRILDRGVGWLVTAAGQRPLPYSISFQGPLVALAPVAELLGGELEVEPLGQGHTLRVADQELVLGPESAVMTNGEEIIPLRDTPRIGGGGLQVPIAVLERTFGDLLGFDFRWIDDDDNYRLVVSRRPRRTLDVEVESVSFEGVSTVVLKFPEAPRYRVARQGESIRVEVLGDRLRPASPDGRVEIEDPLVDGLVIGDDEIYLRLAEGAVAAEPYVVRREDWFQLVFDISRQGRGPGPEGRTAADLRRAERTGDLKIVIDPGHGGVERGAMGPDGAEEKDLTLVLARTLKRSLESRLPVRVVLTRNEDADLPLETRTSIANQNRADLFISLHLNSEVGSTARGAETFFLSMEATDARAAELAEAENRGSAAPGSDDADFGLQLILWDLAQTHHLAESQRLANLIQQELNEALEIRDRGVKQAPFRVLMGATMPAVLVELGFLSNPQEESKLLTASYRSELVSALVRAILRYRAQLLPSLEAARRELP